jgi:hypothetical protein
MSLNVLAYDFRRLLTLLGITATLKSVRTYARFLIQFGRPWDYVLHTVREKMRGGKCKQRVFYTAAQQASA